MLSQFALVFTSALSLSIGSPAIIQHNKPIVIKSVSILDGTGSPAFTGDIQIIGDKIDKIGSIKTNSDDIVFDGRGLTATPGFIDTHSHADANLDIDPKAENQIRQGITTVVIGQDGSSKYPLKAYLDKLTKLKTTVNVASFVGHGTVRAIAMGKDYKKPASIQQQRLMSQLIANEMKSGAFGLSSGLEYDPGFYSTLPELITSAKAAAKYHGIYTSHMRNEDNHFFDAFKELVTISREAHLPAQISHIKLGSKAVWNKAGEVIKSIENARKRGNDVTADIYPYTFWQSSITVLIPTRDWNDRSLWKAGLEDIGGADHVLLSTYSPNKEWEHKTIQQISQETGRDPITVIQDIVQKTHVPEGSGRESVVVTAMLEEDLITFLKYSNTMICSDGMPGGTHPRAAGSFPRIIARYVNELKSLSLTDAVRKMTSLPAKRLGLSDRGILKQGMKADILLFDHKSVKDNATIDHPTALAEGMQYVFVNGSIVINNGSLTDQRPGHMLRHVSLKSKG